jgi:UDP-N-acetylmuramyl pentapeptide synthase
MITTDSIYQKFIDTPFISTDTRKIQKGSLFFALKGENFNGNKFAKIALNNGASYAIIDDEDYILSDKTILVNDVLETLKHLASYHRKKLGIPILAITGTNGKTTVATIFNQLMQEVYGESYAWQFGYKFYREAIDVFARASRSGKREKLVWVRVGLWLKESLKTLTAMWGGFYRLKT